MIQRVLIVHGYYRQRGGEDEVAAAEASLLEARGIEVRRFSLHSNEIERSNRVSVGLRSVWNQSIYRQLCLLLKMWRADVVHFHNTFPLISAAGYRAARGAGAAVVQTLHNYRFSCVNALLFRAGHLCEDCLGKWLPWKGVIHGCYRDSRLASGAAAMAVASLRILGAAGGAVDRFITASRFAASKLVEGGVPPAKLVVKAHVLESDPGPGEGRGNYALFVGRLTREKGVLTLLEAWRRLRPEVPLRFVGAGPLAPVVRGAAAEQPNLAWLGEITHDEVFAQMGDAAFLVIPSEWYETFGRVGLEALARGTPLVAARIGAVAELVDEGRTGLLFTPGDPADLAAAVEGLWARPGGLAAMRLAARMEYEARYDPERNVEQLISIYEQAVAERARHSDTT